MPAYKPATSITSDSEEHNGFSKHFSSKFGAEEHSDTLLLRDGIDVDVVDELHALCGVYTRPDMVKQILTRAGWTRSRDLSFSRLLEPSAGDGAFLVEAVRRLIESLAERGVELTIENLKDRILAFEIVAREATEAHNRVVAALKHLGVHHSTARACVNAWIRNEDFLLASLKNQQFTHIIGNPPYLRWSKIPGKIKARYREIMPKHVTKGDLFLPFLHRSFESLAPNGRCVFICSDRWRYAAYAEEFRTRWRSEMIFNTKPISEPKKVFNRDVSVQAEILTAVKGHRSNERELKRRVRGVTLKDLGCTIRVGPALGVTEAFVLESDEEGIEDDLTHPWIQSKEVLHGKIEWSGRRVISPFDSNGELINLKDYPMFAARLKRFEDRLRSRYIVKKGATWYRTIEKVQPLKWSAPKLLIPDVAKSPRIAVDRSGSIPSHGIYAIFHYENEVSEVYDRLKDGKLAEFLSSISPTLRGGYKRCYRSFLERIEF